MFILASFILLTGFQVNHVTKGWELFHDCQAAVRMADNASGNELMDSTDGRSCLSYVQGFTDGIVIFERKKVCLDSVEIGAMVRVYLAYMAKNPQAMENFQAIGLYGALKEAYPCSAR